MIQRIKTVQEEGYQVDLAELERICKEISENHKQTRRRIRQQEEEEEEEEGEEEEQTSETQHPDSVEQTQANLPRLTDDTLDMSNRDLVPDEARKLKEGRSGGKGQSGTKKEVELMSSGL